jgi:hypothetical protein
LPSLKIHEDGDEFSDCILFSVVAWNHFSNLTEFRLAVAALLSLHPLGLD